MAAYPATPDITSASSRPNKIKVGMVLDQPFPPDARVEREAAALVEAGYEVHLLCAVPEQSPAEYPREEYYRGIYIHRVNPADVKYGIPMVGIQTRLPYKGLLKNLGRILWNWDNAWRTLIDRFVRFYGLDILHIHDLRLVDTGLSVAKHHDIPLVADLHENYPALMDMLKGKDNPARGRKQRQKWEAIELRGATEADRVLTVVEEAKTRLMEKGIEGYKIAVLPNTVDIEKFQQVTPSPEIIRQFKPWFLMTYVGHINAAHRGIHTVLEALAILKPEIPELFFVAAGPVREAYGAQLKALIDQHDLSKRVHFTGWLDEKDFVHYIEASDICLCPHMATDHTNTTFPNKVYLYHYFKKPVITSDCAPLKRYLAESQGGLSFASGNAQELANQIRRLYYDTELKRQLGEAGQHNVLTTNNWANTAPTLLRVYQSLVNERVLS